MPDGLTVQSIRFGNAVVRNPFIANFCAKMMPYRGLGSGIISALKEISTIEFINGVQGEQFISVIARTTFEGVKVQIEGVNSYFERVSDIESLILNLLRESPGQKANEILTVIDKSISTTERYISALK